MLTKNFYSLLATPVGHTSLCLLYIIVKIVKTSIFYLIDFYLLNKREEGSPSHHIYKSENDFVFFFFVNI